MRGRIWISQLSFTEKILVKFKYTANSSSKGGINSRDPIIYTLFLNLKGIDNVSYFTFIHPMAISRWRLNQTMNAILKKQEIRPLPVECKRVRGKENMRKFENE